MFKNIFSIKKTKDKKYVIITLFNFKFKIKRSAFRNPYFKQQYEFYLSRYKTNYIDDITLNELKQLSTTKVSWKLYNNKLWLIYLSMLIEANKDKEDIESLTKRYLAVFNLDDVEKFLPVSYWFYKHNLANEKIEKSAKIYQKIIDSQKENAFFNLIKDKTVAVVGNGPCELGKNKGAEIDSHDVVIRFNEFHIEGHEVDYGSKCDVWANYFTNLDLLNYNVKPDCKLYLWTNDCWNLNSEISIKNALFYIDKKWDIASNIRKYAWEDLCLNYDPTSGFVVIMYIYKLLGSFKNIDFYGFKFLEDEKSKTKHYFKTEFVNNYSAHDFNNEAKFLKNFIFEHK